jgi:plastocyanin
LTVVWLTPVDRQPAQQPAPATFSMAQKDKMFTPRLLVMPVGSTVSFPNHDPFFHNVFSFFNGRRFDLGLYQSGQSRSIVFNRVGVSYIFCNIHPEMSAVIITLDTPYFAYPDEHGDVKIAGVPPGNYTLQVWSEAISPETKQPAGRRVTVNANGNTDLGAIPIQATPGVLADHLNKFGERYDTHSPPAY